MENTHAAVIASLSLALQRTAKRIGADVIALLDDAGSQFELMCSRSGSPQREPQRLPLPSSGLLADAIGPGAIVTPVIALPGSPVAALLTDAVSEHSKSFLLFPWQGSRRGSTGLIGFTDSRPPVSQVPDAVLENLSLLAWAASTAKEIDRLRNELKIVNERLAARKIVERAKSVLQAERSISETQAYEYLRGLSRKRRITLAKLSSEILGRCESIV